MDHAPGHDTHLHGQRPWRVEMTSRGERIVLPKRRVPWQRAIGLGIVVFCVAVVLVAALFTRMMWYRPLLTLLRSQPMRTQDWFGLFGLFVPAIAFFATIRGVRLGLIAAFGHSEIRVEAERVIGIERVGPIARRAVVERATMLAVIVEPGIGSREGRPTNGPMRGLGTLVIEREDDEQLNRRPGVAFAYPIPMLEQLGKELADELGLSVRTEDPPPTHGEDPRTRPAPARHTKRPRGATGVLTETADGCSIELPAMGFFRASKGLGSFAILWLCFITVFTAVFGGAIYKNGFHGGEWIAFVVIGGFWLVGIGMMYGAVRSGRRRGMIDVVGRDLLITRQSIGRPRAESFAGEDIAGVAAGPSGAEINDKPVLELQVWLKDGRKRGFFPERKDAELRWIAGEIAGRLGIRLDDAGTDDGES